LDRNKHHTNIDHGEDLRLYTLLESHSEWVESIRNRIIAANECSRRVRYAMMFTALFSIGLSLVVYNYFFSWNRRFSDAILREMDEHFLKNNPLRQQVIEEWMSTQTYQIPVIGIKIMASDMSLIAPVFFVLITTWLFFVVRREHYTTARLVGDIYYVYKKGIERRAPKVIIFVQEVYHLIIAETVFNVIQLDNPVKRLSQTVVSGKKVPKPKWILKIRFGVYNAIVWLPMLSIVSIAAVRLMTLTILPSHITGDIHDWTNVSSLYKWILMFSVVSVLFGLIVCLLNAIQIINFKRFTRQLLDDYQLWAFRGIEPKAQQKRHK
jgi:hypothetical protein